MVVGVRLGVCCIVIGLSLAAWGVPRAGAEPAEACRDIAARFASAPEQLDLKALARLGACVTTEIGDRVGTTEPSATPREETAPPPLPREEPAPAPAPPGEASASSDRRWGEWPAPAPWMENWPPASPWDR